MGLFTTTAAFVDHHEEAVVDSIQCEYDKKEFHGKRDETKSAKWREGKKHSRKFRGHHAKGPHRPYGKKGKLIYLFLSAILFGGIGYLIGTKCGKCNCCSKKE